MAQESFVEEVANIANTQERMKSAMTDRDVTGVRRILMEGKFKFWLTQTKVTEQIIGSTFIWDHPTLAKLGTAGGVLGSVTGSETNSAVTNVAINLTDDGRDEIGNWLVGSTTGHPTYIAMGTNSQTPNVTDSALVGEVRRFAIDEVTYSSADDTLTFRATRTALTDSGIIIRELGLFNSSSGGVCFARHTHSGYTLTTTSQNYLYMTIKASNTTPVMDGAVTETFNWLSDGSGIGPTHIAWGTDSSLITSSTHSAMISEELRNTISSYSGPTNHKVRLASTMEATQGTGSIYYQSGVYNSDSGGVLFMYGNNPPMNKTDRYQIDTDYGLLVDEM